MPPAKLHALPSPRPPIDDGVSEVECLTTNATMDPKNSSTTINKEEVLPFNDFQGYEHGGIND
jgi:hypothetical protein